MGRQFHKLGAHTQNLRTQKPHPSHTGRSQSGLHRGWLMLRAATDDLGGGGGALMIFGEGGPSTRTL